MAILTPPEHEGPRAQTGSLTAPAGGRGRGAAPAADVHVKAGLCLLLLCLGLMGCAGNSYSGKVTAVADGDTLQLLYRGGEIKIRLAGIDAPERAQPYGRRSRQALSALVFGKNVRVVEEDRDRYGRIVGRVYVDGLDVNAEMVRRGYAWVYRRYARNEQLYALEKQARIARLGLWSLPKRERVPPWEWREHQREPAAAQPHPAATVSLRRYAGLAVHAVSAPQTRKYSRYHSTKRATPCSMGVAGLKPTPRSRSAISA
jgi:micrococcal nuclease